MAILDPVLGTAVYAVVILFAAAFARILFLRFASNFRRLRGAWLSFVVFLFTVAVLLAGLLIYSPSARVRAYESAGQYEGVAWMTVG